MKTHTILAVGAVVAVAGGLTAAVLSGNSAQDAATYAATHPVVTVAAPAKPAPTVTTTQQVPTVPQACLDALDNADLGFTYAGQIMDAASQLDSDTMNAVTEQLNALAPTYNVNKAACRAAGGQ
jgi:hypothetical protein